MSDLLYRKASHWIKGSVINIYGFTSQTNENSLTTHDERWWLSSTVANNCQGKRINLTEKKKNLTAKRKKTHG